MFLSRRVYRIYRGLSSCSVLFCMFCSNIYFIWSIAFFSIYLGFYFRLVYYFFLSIRLLFIIS
nr:MAG TPA: hypothetical protein [Caudoviricetes sp.]